MQSRNLFRLSLIMAALAGSYPVFAQEKAEVAETEVQRETRVNADTKTANDSQEGDIERIEVTGSRLIKDPLLTTRNITTIDREFIDRSGVGTVEELLRKIPQNINSTTSTGSGFSLNNSSFGLGPNVYASSSANLRGLGAAYTLILIDGRRPAKGGMFGDVTDISNIPLERISRIEVLFDGAAAIYGSDAIGGVINIITSRDYAGTEVSVSLDGTTDGGGNTKKINIGHTWNLDKASVTGYASYSKRASINSSQRDLDYTGLVTHPLPPDNPGNLTGATGQVVMWVKDVDGDGRYDNRELGERLSGGVLFNAESWGEIYRAYAVRGQGLDGVDPNARHMLTSEQIAWIESMPDPAAQGYTPVYYAKLPAYNGQALDLYDIPYNLPAGATAEEQYYALGEGSVVGYGQSLTPETTQINTGLRLDYEISSALTLRVSGDVTRSISKSAMRPAGESLTVHHYASSNPFGVPLTYAVDNGLPQEKNKVTQDTYNAQGTLEWRINDNWFTQFNASYSKQESKSEFIDSLYRVASYYSAEDFERLVASGEFGGSLQGRLNGLELVRVRNPDGTIGASQQYRFDGIYFNDPYLGFENAEALREAMINPYYNTKTNTSNNELELYVQGNLLELPGGTVTTNFILSRREEDVRLANNNTTITLSSVLPSVTQSVLDQSFTAKINSIGSEISIPVIGNKNQLFAVNNFALHAALRVEDVNYVDDKATNSSVGFNYKPVESVTFRLNESRNKRLPSPQLALGGVTTTRPTNTIYSCPDSSCSSVTQPGLQVWTIRGAADDLQAEENRNTQLSLIYSPTDNLRFNIDYSKNVTENQIGTAGNSIFITQDLLDNVGNSPFFYQLQDDTVIGGEPFVGRELTMYGTTYVATAGDYVIDNRNFNIKSTTVRTADAGLSYTLDAGSVGQFFFTWVHTRALEHTIIQNNICANPGVVCNAQQDLVSTEYYNKPLELVGIVDRRTLLSSAGVVNPIPKDSGRLQLDWSLEGLTIGLNTNYTSSTRIRNSVREWRNGLSVDHEYDIKTTPALGLDVMASYDFARGGLFRSPDFLKSTTLYIGVSDLIRREQKIEALFKDDDYDYGNNLASFNYSAINPRGRAWNLRLRTTF